MRARKEENLCREDRGRKRAEGGRGEVRRGSQWEEIHTSRTQSKEREGERMRDPGGSSGEDLGGD